jgi:hypothetical protein
MDAEKPTVGRTVHYVSHGTPPREDGTQAFPSVCRAAIVTEVNEVIHFPGTVIPSDDHAVSLCVLNPTGVFFHRAVPPDEGRAPGTWHWTCGT